MILREAYREIMNHVTVTEEMRTRILKNIQNAEIPTAKLPSHSLFIRYFAAAACFVVLIAGAVTLPNLQTPTQTPSPSGVQSGIWSRVEAASLSELSQLVGFEVEELENLPFPITEIQYVAYPGELAEVTYLGETENVVFRKIAGDSDPSGDYTVYADTVQLEVSSISVTLKGEAGVYTLAVWQDDAYSYSIRSSVALSEAEWRSLLESLGD